MATGDKRTNFADKRNVPQQRLKDTFFDYLAAQLLEVTSRVWSSQRGVFGVAGLGAAADVVSVTGLPVELLDGDGNLLILDGTDGTSLQIENTLAVDYEMAARHVLIPSGVERNPRNAVVNYDTWEDRIGESADPTLLVAGAQLNVIVDSIFEVGVSHAGRLVTIYLKAPESAVESVAIERNIAVTWDGSNNRILTAALLGQTVASADAVDYTVVAQGLTIRRNTVLETLPPYAFLGTATGAGSGGTPTMSATGQIDVSDGINSTLDETYNNSGVGKRITLDDEAVEIETPASATGDNQNAQLRLIRFGNSEWMQFMLVLQQSDVSSIPLAILQKRRGVGGVLEDNAADASGVNLLTWTGGGIDLEHDGLRLNERWSFILVSSGVVAEQGLYVIDSATLLPTSFDVQQLQGGVPSSWTAESKTVSILQVQMMVGGSNLHTGGGTILSLLEGTSIFCTGGQQDSRPLRIFGHGCNGPAVEYFDNALRSEGDANEGARTAGRFAPDQISVPGGFVWEFNRPTRIDAGAADGAGGEPATYARDALRLMRGGGDFNTLTPKLCLTFDNQSALSQPEPGPFKGGFTAENLYVRGHGFRDDFPYNQSHWTAFGTGRPPQYFAAVLNGDVFAKTSGTNDGCGAAQLQAQTLNGDRATLTGPLMMRTNSLRGFQWRFAALMRMDTSANQLVRLGLFNPFGLDAYFEYEDGVNGNRWQFVYRDNGGVLIPIDTTHPATTGRWFWLWIAQLGSRTWQWAIADKTFQNQALEDVGGAPTNFSDASASYMWQPEAHIENVGGSGSNRVMLLDYWQWQDVGNPTYGPLFNQSQA